jgi:putative membrane protein
VSAFQAHRPLPPSARSGVERLSALSIIGLVIIPILTGGVLMWALWSPTSNLSRVTAAIVNDDVPVTVNGKSVPLGRQFASELINSGTNSATENSGAEATSSNFTWVLTNDADAASGLADGTYSARVTIPASFSAAATSLSGNASSAHTASLDVQTSPEAAYLDPALTQVLTQVATTSLNRELTTQYLNNLYLAFNNINSQIGQAATGAASVSSGASSVSAGATSLASGAGSLTAGTQSVSSGSAALAAGLGTLGSSAAPLPAQTAQLAAGSNGLASAASAASGSVSDATNQFAAVVAAVCQNPGPACTRATAAFAALQKANSGLSTFATASGQVAAGNSALASAMPSLVSGIDQSASGANQVASGAAQVSSGAESLSTGATSLASGASQVDSGASQLSQSLAEATQKIPTYSDQERETLSKVAAQPVLANQDSSDQGLQAVPLFSVIALWFGGFAIALVRQAVHTRQLMTSRSSISIAVGSVRTGALIGIAQGLLVASIVQSALALTPDRWVSFAAVSMIAGGVFAIVNQGLAAAFGAVGRLIAVVIGVVALAAGLSSTVPPFFASLAALFPTSPALTMLRAAATGDPGQAWLGILAPVIFAIIGAILVVAGVAGRRSVRARAVRAAA